VIAAFLQTCRPLSRTPRNRMLRRKEPHRRNERDGRNDGRQWRTLSQSKEPEANKRVKAITHCSDTYRVTTADEKTRAFWEGNLRFVTDRMVRRKVRRQSCRTA
jgi:hypothetical protein